MPFFTAATSAEPIASLPGHSSGRTYWLVAAGLLVLYLLPYVWLGEEAYLTIHDNLDSDFLYLHLLRLTKTAFAFDLSTVIPNVMSGSGGVAYSFQGVPRSALRTGLNLEVVSFYLLPPYVAQVVNFVVVHGIGFLGMALLLKRYTLPEPQWAFTRVAIALLFALVPFYTVHGISVSGQPLLLFAFLNLLAHRARWTDWLIIGLFPFYSFFVWSGLFICVALGLIGLVGMGKHRRLNGRYAGGLALLSGLYLLSEWQMVYSFLAKTYVSHRTAYDYAQLMRMSVGASLRKSVHFFVQTQYHPGAFLTIWILFIVGVAVICAYRQNHQSALLQMILCVGTAAVICLITGFYRFPAVWLGKGSLLQVFQFDRFYFLLPPLWFYLLALALREFQANGRWNRVFLVGQLVVMVAANDEWRTNVGKIGGLTSNEATPSYNSFYAPRLFDQIGDYIGRPPSSYRVVSIGMHPAVALYNGFYTLDGYQNNYRLAYKHAFRRVIERELAKAPAIENYYDAYGCRCYVFSAELGIKPESFLCGKNQGRVIRRLALNTAALHALGGDYVLSAVAIQNAAQNQLKLERIFDDPGSYWRVWLYRVE